MSLLRGAWYEQPKIGAMRSQLETDSNPCVA